MNYTLINLGDVKLVVKIIELFRVYHENIWMKY